jgi:phosphoserine phosphatase
MMDRPFYIFVDIDDTIVNSVGTKRIPIPHAIKHVRELKEAGAILYCWSSGGPEYARDSAKEFGIEDCFTNFLPKPNAILDDQDITDWRRFIWVHPSNARNLTLADYLAKVEGK